MNKELVFRVIGFTDPHHTMRNPVNRITNIFDDTMEKIDEIIEVSNELPNIPTTTIVPGDIFDSPDISDNVAGLVGEKYSNFKDILAIAGNHDLRGNNLSTLPQTKLGLLDKLGIIRVIKPYEKIFRESKGVKIQFTGTSSDFGIESDIDNFIIKEKDADIAIHMIHGMLLSQKPNFGNYVPVKSIQQLTLADITISGHHHLGFDPIFEDGKLFVNPGSIIRKYNFIEEMTRTPQILVINIYSDKTFDYELRPLKCAKKGELVLDRSVIEAKQLYNSFLKEYSNNISNLKHEGYNVNLSKLIEDIANQDNLEDDVIKMALSTLELAKTNLKLED